MGFYWDPSSLPELRDLPKEQRRQICESAQRRAGNRWEVLIAIILCIAAVTAVGIFVDHFKHPLFPPTLCFAVGFIATFLIFMRWYVSFIRPLIWERIRGLWSRCGY